MIKHFIYLLAIAGFMAAGNQAAAQEGDGKHFGEAITADKAIDYDKMLKKIKSKKSYEGKVVGTVEGVCQMKGCWMKITSTDPGKPDMTVQFKDYGFFVPKDIAGRRVVMQGQAYLEVTPVDELKHMAEDAGKTPAEIAAITKPKEELKFLATGVLLLD